MTRYLRNLDIRYLISMVEARPVLWDRTEKSYRDKMMTRMAWDEIYRELIEGFDDLDERLQKEIGKAITKKWWNIRDGFVKSTKRDEEVATAADFGMYKQTKYVHFDQMQFLLKRKGDNETIRDWWKEDGSQDHIYEGTKGNSATEEHLSTDSLFQDETEPSEGSKHIAKKIKLTVDESALLEENMTFQMEEEGEEENVLSRKTKKNFGLSNDTNLKINIKQEMLGDASSSEEAGASSNSKAEHQVRSETTELLMVLEEPAYRHMSFFKGVIPALVTFDEDDVLDFQLGVLQLIKRIKEKGT